MLPVEGRHRNTCIHPEKRADGSTPSLGLAKEIEQLLAFLRQIASPRRLDLYLASKSDGVNRLRFRQIGDAQLQRDQRHGGIGNRRPRLG